MESGEIVRQSSAVLLRLDFHAGKRRPLRLRFYHASRLLVDVQQIVGLAVTLLQGELSHRNPAASVQVYRVGVLDYPARLLEEPVYVCAGLFFWVHIIVVE